MRVMEQRPAKARFPKGWHYLCMPNLTAAAYGAREAGTDSCGGKWGC